ncbi:hypothetical protein UlMin_017570 [Ulmus minor]
MTNEVPELRKLNTVLHCSGLDNLPARITVKEHMYILAEIKEHLDDWELDLFRSTCFGHFLDVDAGWTEGAKVAQRNTFADQYVHFLMLRRMQTLKMKELWFLVEGKPTRFSIDEFALVIGLRCHDEPILLQQTRVKLKNRLCNEHFNSSLQIKLQDLTHCFRNLCKKENSGKEKKGKKQKKKITQKCGREDRVKIALVWFLEGALLSSDPKKNISEFHLSLVDELDIFNEYPWGKVAFDMTFDSLWVKNLAQKYRDRLRKSPHKQLPNVKETYTLYGFPFAFQVSILLFNQLCS